MDRLAVIAATIALTCGVAGCQGKATSKSKQKQKPVTPPPPQMVETGPCPAPPYRAHVSAKLLGKPDASFETPNLELVDAVAVKLKSGNAYTFLLGDFAIDRKVIGRKTLRPPRQHLLITAMASYPAEVKEPAPMVAGLVVPTAREHSGPELRVTLERGAQKYALGPGATGRLIIRHLDDEKACVEIDYRDNQKRVTGIAQMDVLIP